MKQLINTNECNKGRNITVAVIGCLIMSSHEALNTRQIVEMLKIDAPSEVMREIEDVLIEQIDNGLAIGFNWAVIDGKKYFQYARSW